jgi:hypothetical protein
MDDDEALTPITKQFTNLTNEKKNKKKNRKKVYTQ